MSKRNNENKMYDTYKKIRRDWGDMNPSTKIFKSKKRKQKYQDFEDEYGEYDEGYSYRDDDY